MAAQPAAESAAVDVRREGAVGNRLPDAGDAKLPDVPRPRWHERSEPRHLRAALHDGARLRRSLARARRSRAARPRVRAHAVGQGHAGDVSRAASRTRSPMPARRPTSIPRTRPRSRCWSRSPADARRRRARAARAPVGGRRRCAPRTASPPRSRSRDCLDAQGDTDAAFAAYAHANELAPSAPCASGSTTTAPGANGRPTSSSRVFRSHPAGTTIRAARPTPIFIVGMPRSGTTLIESIIGAHSGVFACGERQEMRSIMQEFVVARRRASAWPALPEPRRQRWREAFWRELPDLHGAVAVTDKNPWNFDALGLILELFPHAPGGSCPARPGRDRTVDLSKRVPQVRRRSRIGSRTSAITTASTRG